MYFVDFVSKHRVSSNYRYFLSGDSNYLKNFVIEKLAAQSGRKPVRVSTAKELQLGRGLFDVPVLWVSDLKGDFKLLQDFTVKLSKNKMPKSYLNNGFIEVICSQMFPNQVSKFTVALLESYHMPRSYAEAITILNKYDPYSIYNTVRALSYLDTQLTHDELIDYCGKLTTPDVFNIVDFFIEGDYLEFLGSIRETGVNMSEVLWALLGTLMKLHQVYLGPRGYVSWYHTKMLNAATRLAPAGLHTIISYVKALSDSYYQSKASVVTGLLKLVYYLKGFQTDLVFLDELDRTDDLSNLSEI